MRAVAEIRITWDERGNPRVRGQLIASTAEKAANQLDAMRDAGASSTVLAQLKRLHAWRLAGKEWPPPKSVVASKKAAPKKAAPKKAAPKKAAPQKCGCSRDPWAGYDPWSLTTS